MSDSRLFLNRRALLKGAAAAPFIQAAKAETRPPNILIVITDQQSADAISFRAGRRFLRTPAMDSLAANGTFFSRAYCSNPLCVPSRTSMFTGRYPSETGVQDTTLTPIDHLRFPLMGSLFRRAGYATPYFGKWHIPYAEANASTHGFDLMPRDRKKGDDGIAASAAAFLRASRREPFLMVASFVNPHNICEWARGEPLPEGTIGGPPAVQECPPRVPNHEPQRNEPDGVAMMRRSYQNTPTFPVSGFDEKKWREYRWAYYRMIEKVDGVIGQVLAGLRDAGQEERTIVVFMADHGDCQGAHRWNQKTVFYDESARVPLIISRKGVTKAGVSNGLVNTGLDLLPTVCDYAGIGVPEGLLGVSLKDSASGANGRDRRRCVVVSNKMVQGGPIDGRIPILEGRMIRSDRYKYCLYNEGRLRESLVDMEKDPGEMVNLAVDSAFRDELRRHRLMLKQFQMQTRDSFPM